MSKVKRNVKTVEEVLSYTVELSPEQAEAIYRLTGCCMERGSILSPLWAALRGTGDFPFNLEGYPKNPSTGLYVLPKLEQGQ